MDGKERMTAENTFAVAIDFQERILPAIAQHEEMVRKSVILLSGLRELGVPTVLTTQYVKGLGPNIAAIAEAIGSGEAIDKTTFSVYRNETARARIDALAAQGRRFAVIAGPETHICVLQTTLDLLAAGFVPVLAADCISSRSLVDKEFGLRRAEAAGAVVTTAEAILYELLEDAKAPAFKAISKLVK